MRSGLISPQAVPEAKIIQAVEAYESDYKEYVELGGSELGDEYRTQALRNMLTGELRRYIHLQYPEGNYESLRQQVYHYAMLAIKDSRTAGGTVNTVTTDNVNDWHAMNSQSPSDTGSGYNGYEYDIPQDVAQTMDSQGNFEALGKGRLWWQHG